LDRESAEGEENKKITYTASLRRKHVHSLNNNGYFIFYNDIMDVMSVIRIKKGFTLIELLVVIAIVAILAVVVVLTINPAALLQQGRDATRVSDMGTINKAVSLYYQDAMNSPSTTFMGTSSVIYLSVPDPAATTPAGDQCQGLGLPTPPTGYTYQCAASSTYMSINGTGWIPINFSSYSAGTVISKLPVDPVNTTSTNLYYTYETDGIGGFKVAAFFESQKDAPQMANDGGNDPELYEKGSNLSLLSTRGLIGYWNLDEGTGNTAYDMSGNGDNGTWHGNASGTSGHYVGGEVGTYAGYFNGNGTSSVNYVNLGSATVLDPSVFTIAGWLNPYTTSGAGAAYNSILSNGRAATAGYNGITFQGNGSSTCLDIENGSTVGTLCAPSTLTAGTWTFIAGTYDGSVMNVYVNGALSASKSYAGGVGQPASFNSYIGAWGYSNGAFEAQAFIDDVRIYGQVLSPAEIQEMYNAEE
jgi:prepilin-type N-terminal cleavage/methylation domain-containing protein